MLSVIILSVIMLSVVMVSVIMLSVIMLSVVMLIVIMLSVAMLSVVVLTVVMLSVVILNVVAPMRAPPAFYYQPYYFYFLTLQLRKNFSVNIGIIVRPFSSEKLECFLCFSLV
jgi:hypothetical protein